MISVVIVNGLGGSGKSTMCGVCRKVCDERGIVCTELSTVTEIKKVAEFCGWKGDKSTESRIFLSDLKKALAKWADIPIRSVFYYIDEILKAEENEGKEDFLFFVNSREPEDIDRIKEIAKEKGWITREIIVTNPNIESNEVPELVEDIINRDYDLNVVNDGTVDDLYGIAKNYLVEYFMGTELSEIKKEEEKKDDLSGQCEHDEAE